MKLQLRSDFIDYYDHYFDRNGIVFNRYSRNNISRLEMFNMMENWGLKVPEYGLCNKLSENNSISDNKVVVYLDQYAHQGEDKELLSLEKACLKHPQKLGSIYIPTSDRIDGFKSISYRLLQVGIARFWILYCSPDDWRSNAGNCSIEVLKTTRYYGYTKVPYPLFAIDFVAQNKLYAIDFNTSPGIKHTGIENIFKAEEVVNEIKKFYEIYNQHGNNDIDVYTGKEEKEILNFNSC